MPSELVRPSISKRLPKGGDDVSYLLERVVRSARKVDVELRACLDVKRVRDVRALAQVQGTLRFAGLSYRLREGQPKPGEERVARFASVWVTGVVSWLVMNCALSVA